VDTSRILAQILTSIVSIMDSANLRNRLYLKQQRIDELELAVEDIERINGGDNKLIEGICQRLREQ